VARREGWVEGKRGENKKRDTVNEDSRRGRGMTNRNAGGTHWGQRARRAQSEVREQCTVL
jgi:hypothetical protein